MSFWSKIFKSKPVLMDPADLSVLKTDFHSHLIPAIDDGSKSIEDSINLIKGLMDLGYKKIITTPHVMNDYYKNTPEIIQNGFKKVQNEIQRLNLEVEFEVSAEYYLDDDFERKINDGEVLPFGDNYILFELPFIAEPPNLSQVIFTLQSLGYKVILAHPERYGYYYNNFNAYQEFVDRGVFLQINLMSLISYYSPETQKIAEKLIDNNLVQFLGTDLHNTRQLEILKESSRTPYLHQLLASGNLLNNQL